MSRFELQDVKAAAAGHWPAILNRVAGIDDDYLDTRHHGPCPKCGGTDRWRFTDLDDNGGAICNQCGRYGDGLAVLQWYLGVGFPEALRLTAEFLGLQPVKKTKTSNKKKKSGDPFRNLEFIPWSDGLAGIWCLRKRVKLEALKTLDAKMVRYRKRYTAIALPILGENDRIIGWTLYEATGGKLPLYNPKTEETTWLKVKVIKE